MSKTEINESFKQLYTYEYYLFRFNFGKAFIMIGIINAFFYSLFLLNINLDFAIHFPTIRFIITSLVLVYLIHLFIRFKRTYIEEGQVKIVGITLIKVILLGFWFFTLVVGDALAVSIFKSMFGVNAPQTGYYINLVILFILTYGIGKMYFVREKHKNFLVFIILALTIAVWIFEISALVPITEPPFDAINYIEDSGQFWRFFYSNGVTSGLILFVIGIYEFIQSKNLLGAYYE